MFRHINYVMKVKVFVLGLVFIVMVSGIYAQDTEQISASISENIVMLPVTTQYATISTLFVQVIYEEILKKNIEKLAIKYLIIPPNMFEDTDTLLRNFLLDHKKQYTSLMMVSVQSLSQDNTQGLEAVQTSDSENKVEAFEVLSGLYAVTVSFYYAGISNPVYVFDFEVELSDVIVSGSEQESKEQLTTDFNFILQTISKQVYESVDIVESTIIRINTEDEMFPNYIFKSDGHEIQSISSDRRNVFLPAGYHEVEIFQTIDNSNDELFLGGFSTSLNKSEYELDVVFVNEDDENLNGYVKENRVSNANITNPVSLHVLGGYQASLMASVNTSLYSGPTIGLLGIYAFDRVYVGAQIFAGFISNADSTDTSMFENVLLLSSGYSFPLAKGLRWSIGGGTGVMNLMQGYFDNNVPQSSHDLLPVVFAETQLEFNGVLRGNSYLKGLFALELLSTFAEISTVDVRELEDGTAVYSTNNSLNIELILKTSLGIGIRF